ncbi:MAG: hypothetical protein COV46_08620 [Deltaproteobacteria bacterium CG11_big_fil_rev_8_21_14_0_20_49_13]|nr:MAG: hypothetical protein COV46_08620 [Deltaproteobacteria bacterium CG11_big_fil_rev_8_21_14_0_20_49_13]
MIKILLSAAIAAALLFPNVPLAKKPPSSKKTAVVKDSEYDTLGNTCKADGKCTFTRREMLPGNIPAELQVVSLGGFNGDVEKLFNYIFEDIRRVASLLDENNPSSEVSKVNDNAGVGFVEVGPEFAQLMVAVKKSFLWTNGAFDITTTPEIGNFNQIKVKGNGGNLIYLKKKGMKISFKNIIHGYLADLLIRGAYNANIDNALADVGPAKRGIGQSVAGNWRTEVNDSEGRYAKRGMTLDISNVSVASAVINENAPKIDPRWGTSISPSCRSVTIISRNAAVSESLASGIFVLGADNGMDLIKKLQTIRGIIVGSNGEFLKSPGL